MDKFQRRGVPLELLPGPGRQARIVGPPQIRQLGLQSVGGADFDQPTLAVGRLVYERGILGQRLVDGDDLAGGHRVDAAERTISLHRLDGEQPISLVHLPAHGRQLDEKDLAQHPLGQIGNALDHQIVLQTSVRMRQVIVQIERELVARHLGRAGPGFPAPIHEWNVSQAQMEQRGGYRFGLRNVDRWFDGAALGDGVTQPLRLQFFCHPCQQIGVALSQQAAQLVVQPGRGANSGDPASAVGVAVDPIRVLLQSLVDGDHLARYGGSDVAHAPAWIHRLNGKEAVSLLDLAPDVGQLDEQYLVQQLLS